MSKRAASNAYDLSATSRTCTVQPAARRSFAMRACLFVLPVAAILYTLSAQASPDRPADPWLRPAEVPAPADNQPNAARVGLGHVLFFDPRLSGSNFVSCAGCHNPSMGWSDGLPTAFGAGFKPLKRSTPTIVNTAYNPIQMWDGRKRTLEDQALGPIESPEEMGQPLSDLVMKLNKFTEYQDLFEKAYPGEGISPKTIAKALASYERTVVSGEAPFDRWRKGDEQAISASAKKGFDLFQNKASCAKCHGGFNFTDNAFHNIGLRNIMEEEDLGRFAIMKKAPMKGAFKTPTLREIELTAPYMHNGMYRTLEEVIDHYDRGGDVASNLSPDVKPLGLSTTEKKDLVEFMRTLTSPMNPVTLPRLPTR